MQIVTAAFMTVNCSIVILSSSYICTQMTTIRMEHVDHIQEYNDSIKLLCYAMVH